MITASAALNSLLLTSDQLVVVDCYDITLQDGTVIRWTSADAPVAVDIAGVRTLFSVGPLITRNNIKLVIGVQVDSLTLTLTADDAVTIGSVPLIKAAVSGRLDGATVRLYRAYAADWTSGWVGVLTRFAGTVADVSGGRSQLEIKVNNHLQLLNTQQPVRSYQAGCTWTLYDTSCAASKHTSIGTVVSVAQRWEFQTSIDSGATNLGTSMLPISLGVVLQGGQLKFTSGKNSGFTYPVKTWSGSTATLLRPAGLEIAVGDSFQVTWGCNKTIQVCDFVYANKANYGGFPFIPAAETAVPV
ncbi:DUF2163 domain-containing protein [Limnohabitans sp.]|uniref:DUF2163 domain-containing protein n=1 Tax=Limnohabitans sp. TaxID=1907725 RepID=UPI00286F8CC0|nr:DUF2163 domain-containing protein [Limnohabitans sp.]